MKLKMREYNVNLEWQMFSKLTKKTIKTDLKYIWVQKQVFNLHSIALELKILIIVFFHLGFRWFNGTTFFRLNDDIIFRAKPHLFVMIMFRPRLLIYFSCFKPFIIPLLRHVDGNWGQCPPQNEFFSTNCQ